MLVPRMLVFGAPGGASPVSSITGVTATTTRQMTCTPTFYTWQVTAGWTIADANDADYSLSLLLLQPSSTTILTNQTCASGTHVYDTGTTGDTTGLTNTGNVQFRLQLVRRSDLVVIQTVDSNTVSETWTSCSLP